MNDDFIFHDFPIIGSSYGIADFDPWNISPEEIQFSGQYQNLCVCFIDIVSSTSITSTLSEEKAKTYYSTFLNSMATIVKNFEGKTVKNQGDCLIYYFPATADPNNRLAFKNVLECGMTMIAAHRIINGKLNEENLPPLNYRISAVYGRVEIARSKTSQNEDLFGSSMNLCSKINSKSPPNNVVIGEDLYRKIKSFSFNEYSFRDIGEYASTMNNVYKIYLIESQSNRNILNPFTRKFVTKESEKIL